MSASMGGSIFFNDTATTEIYTLSLHDALPICAADSAIGASRRCFIGRGSLPRRPALSRALVHRARFARLSARSEEHTSELQSRQYLVCRLLLEKKKNIHILTSRSTYLSYTLFH